MLNISYILLAFPFAVKKKKINGVLYSVSITHKYTEGDRQLQGTQLLRNKNCHTVVFQLMSTSPFDDRLGNQFCTITPTHSVTRWPVTGAQSVTD